MYVISCVDARLQVSPVTEEFQGLVRALQTVHELTVDHEDPPARREVTRDILTQNLVQIARFMERTSNVLSVM